MLHSFNERKGSECVRACGSVCVKGGEGEGLSIFFFPPRIQYRSESNIDMIFSIIL